MFATVELNEEILTFIKYSQEHKESFDEIKELVFTQKRLKDNYNITEMFNLSLQFQDIKKSAIKKVLNQEKLNFPEGFVMERLIAKYFNENTPSVEEHIKQIKLNCCNDRKSKRENERKISKLYNKLLNKLSNQKLDSSERRN